MARLAVSGKNVSFSDSSAGYSPPKPKLNLPVLTDEEKERIDQLLNQALDGNKEAIGLLLEVMKKVASKEFPQPEMNSSPSIRPTQHPSRSAQLVGGIMPERNQNDEGMFAARNIEFRERIENIIKPHPGHQSTSKTSSHSARLLGQAIKGEYRYAMLGLVLGLACIIGGTILGLNGVAGSTSWTAKVLGLESQINDAAPGVVLFIVGIFLVFITRPKVDLQNLKG